MVFINHTEVLSGEAAIVEVDGPLDSKTSPDFEEYINQLLERNLIYILLDASKLEFVSSEGIGVMLYIQKKISESNGCFIIFNLSGEILSLYKILGFDKVFNTSSGKIEALQMMDRQMEMREETGIEEMESYSLSLEEDEDLTADETFIPKDEPPAVKRRTEPKKAPKPENVPFAPFIVECVHCKTLIRIKQSGEYLCPTCKNELMINSDQTVVFKNA